MFLSVLAGSASAAHFKLADSSTGSSMTVIVDTAIHPAINGLPMHKGDEIAVFDTNGNCYGATVWDSSQSSGITVWGQNSEVSTVDGMGTGEVMRFRVWDTAAGEMPATSVFYPPDTNVFTTPTSSDSLYVFNGISMLKSLSGLSAPAAPALSSPTNGATNLATSLTFSWAALSGAASYGMQVSTVSTFGTTVSGQTGITGTARAVSGLSNSTIYYWRANAANTAGTSAWSGVWRFTTIAAVVPPAAPTLSSPTNGATGLATALTVSWSTSTGATTYAAQVSTISTFASTVSNQTGLVATSAAVGGLANGATYYWRANATNTAGTSAWSSVWSFTTIVAVVPPAAPTLSTPTNGATGQATSLTLSWGAVTGAASYGVQVSTVSTFASTISSLTGLAAASTAVGGLSYDATYYWRANATNGAGTSVWSSIWDFTTLSAPAAPALSAPANGATGQATSLTLSWGAVTGAASYGVQVSTVSTFASTISSLTGLAAASTAVGGLSYDATYYWRANAANGAGTSVWSSIWDFTTLSTPAAPTLATPANGATGQATSLTLSWGAVTGAASYGVQVSTVSTFASTISSLTGLAAASTAVGGLATGTTYYWRANATNGAGTSVWSSIWDFTTLSALGAPTLAAPANGATGQATSLTLSWGAVTGAASYGVQVSTVSTFASTISSLTGLAAASTAVGGLATGTTYYWRANATNGAGTSVWSSIWDFTTLSAPGAPALATPANGAIGQATSLTLSWGAVTGAASYGVQVSTVSTFASTISSLTGLAATSTAVGNLSYGATYYWRANAANGAGTSAWSTVWSFATIPSTVVVVLSSPANGAINQPTSLTMNWGSATGALSYTLQVSPASTFATTVSNQAGLTGTSGSVTGLATGSTYYWRVNATNAGGVGAWSSVWSFVTVPAVPLAPTLTSPGDGAGFAPNATVTLVWGTVTGAATYTVQVSTISTFTTTVLNESGTALTAAFINSSGSVHYWRVNADNAGGTSAWSAIRSFTTTTAVLPTVADEMQSAFVSFAHGALSYCLKVQARVEITLFDILGKKALSIGEVQAAGSHRLPLNEAILPSGRYLLRFKAGGLLRDVAITITR